MLKTKNILFPAVGLVWAVSMAWFGLSAGGCPRRHGAGPSLQRGDAESWYGLYLGPDKIGHSVTLSRALPGGGRSVSNRSLMRIAMMGTPQEVASALSYDLDRSFSLQSFDFRISGAADIRVKGRVLGRRLMIEVETQGRNQHQELALSGPVTLPEALEPLLAGRVLRPGDRFTYSMFDPSSMSLQPAAVTVAGQESLKLGGRKVWSTKLTTEFSGITSQSWVDSLGGILREEGPLGMVLVAETKEQALKPDGSPQPLDLLTSLSVPSLGKGISDPRNTSRSIFRLLDIESSGFDLEGGRQRLDSLRLSVSREPPPQASQDALPDSLKRWLAPTALIQSSDPAIIKLADSLCRVVSDHWAKSAVLSHWVFASLEKRMSVTLPSAVEVLASRRGDCNEHATLFCALARAQGIPTRLCLGVVYLDGRFYYHAWNAVWRGGWIEVDPTFGQIPADAARIRLVSGDLSDQGRLLPAMGRLKVEVVEWR
jgi:hypothetical protein